MANEQKLKETIRTLKTEKDDLLIKVKDLEKNVPLLTKSGDKVAGLELKLEESEGKVSTLKIEVNSGNETIKGMQSSISSLEKKVGKISGDYPKLPTGSTFITEVSLNEDETVQLWKVGTKDKGIDITLQIVLNKGKATTADFTTK